MKHASGRSALMIAVGLWIAFGGPLQVTAQAGTDSSEQARTSSDKRAGTASARHRIHHFKRHAVAHGHRRKSFAHRAGGKIDVTDASPATADVLPAEIANARAQLSAADLAATDATSKADRARKAGAEDNLQSAASTTPASAEIVAPEELNDLDRAATEPRPIPAPAKITDASGDNAWSQTSLIGKIFIALGGLLTMASAARMFMA